MDVLLEKLNRAQIEAINSTEGYVQVIAGPGSGKTRTIVNRYRYLIENCGITSSHILCLTFTNKAANVMNERLKKFFGPSFSGMIYTFHGLCAKILRKEIYKINFPATFNIIDDDDKENIYKTIYEKLSLEKTNIKYSDMDRAIHVFKVQYIIEYIDYLTDITNSKTFEEVILNLLQNNEYIIEYLNIQRKNYLLDFDDLILMCLYIFYKSEKTLNKYQEKFQYIMVDEFQDINDEEFAIVELLPKKHKNLFVVGDPDQRIYTWRGAKDYLGNFKRFFSPCITIVMNMNYRSTPEIIKISNEVIAYNKDRIPKKMITCNENDKIPIFYHAKNQYDETNWICQNIKRILKENHNLSDIAVIYRMNRNSKYLEDAFVKNNIPYKIIGSVGFYDRKEIKDLLSYLRFVTNYDDFSFKRIINCPSRQIGKKKLKFLYEKQLINNKSLYDNCIEYKDNPIFKNCKLEEFLELIKNCNEMIKKETVSNLLNFIYKKSGYEKMIVKESNDDRLENINELLDNLKNLENNYGEKLTLQDYLEMVSLNYNNQTTSNGDDKVSLMTAHASKGTEYKFVFVCSLNEGVFPSDKANNIEKMEEERRLFYVSITRAEKELYLSDSIERTNMCSNKKLTSRFIYEINPKNLVCEGVKINLENEIIEQNDGVIENAFVNNENIGKKVKHTIFGEGFIVGIDVSENSYIIKFKCFKSERNISDQNKFLVIFNKK